MARSACNIDHIKNIFPLDMDLAQDLGRNIHPFAEELLGDCQKEIIPSGMVIRRKVKFDRYNNLAL